MPSRYAILKYGLVIDDEQVISMPAGSKILDAKMQGCHLVMWVLCRSTNEPVRRLIHIYGTGNPIPDEPGTYIATVMADPYVWHIFEGRLQ